MSYRLTCGQPERKSFDELNLDLSSMSIEPSFEDGSFCDSKFHEIAGLSQEELPNIAMIFVS